MKKMSQESKINTKPLCLKCGGNKLISKDDGWHECDCVVKERFRLKLAPLLPAPRITPEIKVVADKILRHKSDPKRVILPKMLNDTWKSAVISYLVSSGNIADYKYFQSYYLIDLFLGNIEDTSIYDFTQKTIVISHGYSEIGNRQEINILQQFCDIYHDRNIITYSHAVDKSAFKVSLISRGFKQL